MIGLVDRVLAVLAMLVAIRPIVAGLMAGESGLSWRRGAVLAVGGASSLGAAVGFLLVRRLIIGEGPLWVPTWLGGSLACFGGMLGLATLFVPRGERGMTEDRAIRFATQSVAMVAYLAAPRLAAACLGVTRLGRACLPWTLAEGRWLAVAEGVTLVAAALLPRDEALGGLLMSVPLS